MLHAWRRWIEDVPDELTSVGRFLQFPPIPNIPEPLRGRSFVVVEATSLGDEDDGRELLRPLRELGPAMDTFATIPVEQLQLAAHGSPEHPVPGHGDGMLLRRPRRTTRSTRSSPSQVRIRVAAPLGRGAAPRRRARAEVQPGHGALASIEADFAMFAVGMTMTPGDARAAVKAHVEVVQAALCEVGRGRDYLNCTERRERGERLFGGDRRIAACRA